MIKKVVSVLRKITLSSSVSPVALEDEDFNALESLYVDNALLFLQVKEILKRKIDEQNFDDIIIDCKLEENQYDRNRIFVALDDGKNNYIKILNDVFTNDEADKIEKIFKMRFKYIDSTVGSCAFAIEVLTNYDDEILYVSNSSNFEAYIRKKDNETIKKLCENWYLHRVR